MFAGPSWQMFKIFGLPISAHWSLLVALALMGISSGGLSGIMLGIFMFVSVLLHELGHAAVAIRRRVPMEGIDLHLFGGVAKMKAPPRSPKDEIAIAAAGPLVSLMLGGVLACVAWMASPEPPMWLWWTAAVNLMLGVFNLLPALPMDGGRVLRAILARKQGLVRGTTTAVKVSQGISLLLAIAGILGNPWLICMAVMVWFMGAAEVRQIKIHEKLQNLGYRNSDFDPWVRYERACPTNPAPKPQILLPSEPDPQPTEHPTMILEEILGHKSRPPPRPKPKLTHRLARDSSGFPTIVTDVSYHW
jgi:Zn-dependent protease